MPDRPLVPVVLFFLLASLVALAAGDDMRAEGAVVMVDFAAGGEQDRWRIVNDSVMGGVSSSRFSVTSEGTAVFEGSVSLENNGGFASVRRLPSTYALDGREGLELRVRGDGQRYELRLRTNDRFDGVAWRAPFDTTDGDWVTIRIPFDRFAAGFRGFRVPDAGPLDVARVRQIGFLIADKQSGPFRLEVRSIAAY